MINKELDTHPDDYNFSKNLRNIMNNRKLTGEKLGEMVGVGKSTVINWSNGSRFPKEENIKKLVEVLKVSFDDLFCGEKDFIETNFVPLIGKASHVKPNDYDLNGYEPVAIPTDMYINGTYAIEAEGDSMSPKVSDGDIVYCCPSKHVDSGKIVHYWLNGESGIKKYKINEKETIISLIPINPDHDIITIHHDDVADLHMARIVGKIDKDF